MKRNLPLITVVPLAVILLLTVIIPIYASYLSAATGISEVINLTTCLSSQPLQPGAIQSIYPLFFTASAGGENTISILTKISYGGTQ